MKIENLRKIKGEGRVKVCADVSWEDCDRPAYELYFETSEEFEQDLTCNPNAFLIACAIPALHFGEKRVFIDGEVCPELLDGLHEALAWLRHWSQQRGGGEFQIQARTKANLSSSNNPKRAGFFFSGGIDAFSTLRTNRLQFSDKHPWSIKDGLLVYGLEMDDPLAFEYVLDSLSSADFLKIIYCSGLCYIS